MGIYLNPGNKSFWESIRSRIYVDKTGLIGVINERINTKEKYICVSRPRRFGKSMTLEMLLAYYSRGCDSRELFKGCKIEAHETFGEYLNQYDVIFLNIQRFLSRAKELELTEYLEQKETINYRKNEREFYTKGTESIFNIIIAEISSNLGKERFF